ncbi:MAG TPA: hypothetical protein VGH66_15230 [Acidimicrobiales bacterium]|jgi:hypothetical protein|nr:hypothetical protein [Trebonia sp.]
MAGADPDQLVGWSRVASYCLGAAVIVDALVTHASAVQWVAGLVLVGIIPPEAVIARLIRGHRSE